jgi:hypothetical protein
MIITKCGQAKLLSHKKVLTIMEVHYEASEVTLLACHIEIDLVNKQCLHLLHLPLYPKNQTLRRKRKKRRKRKGLKVEIRVEML